MTGRRRGMGVRFRVFVARLGDADITAIRHAQGGEQGARGHPESMRNEKHHRLCAFGQARPTQVAIRVTGQRLRLNLPKGRAGQAVPIADRIFHRRSAPLPVTMALRRFYVHARDFISPGALRSNAKAWTPPAISSARTALTARWRSTRLKPSNLAETILTRKWVSPPCAAPPA